MKTVQEDAERVGEKEHMMPKYYLFLASLLFIQIGFAQPVFEEKAGILIIEAEHPVTDASDWGDWSLKTSINGYNGEGHIEFDDGSMSDRSPGSQLKYRFKINKSGSYKLFLRAHKRLEGAEPDKCNDAFVRMDGDFSSGNPEVATHILGMNTKLYGGAQSGWGWASNLDGNGADHTPAIYNFKAGETYTFYLVGRSVRFNIDRICFINTSFSDDPEGAGYLPESLLLGRAYDDSTAPEIVITDTSRTRDYWKMIGYGTDVMLNIAADVSDTGSGIAMVQCFLDGVPFGFDTRAPYAFAELKLDRYGEHTVYLKALDNTYNSAISDTVVFHVASPTSVRNQPSAPDEFILQQNVPNPFNHQTRITYQLPHSSRIRITVFDVLGNRVRTLANGLRQAGIHTADWNGRDQHGTIVSSGVYYYQIRTLDASVQLSQTRKMLFLQ